MRTREGENSRWLFEFSLLGRLAHFYAAKMFAQAQNNSNPTLSAIC